MTLSQCFFSCCFLFWEGHTQAESRVIFLNKIRLARDGSNQLKARGERKLTSERSGA